MTVTGMAWHLLLPCHTERGEPGSRPFPNSCPDLRKADCSLLRLKFRVAEALLPAAPPRLHPAQRPWLVRGLLPQCGGGRGLLIAALERLPCQVDRAVDLGCS